jgi:hypothetical protein
VTAIFLLLAGAATFLLRRRGLLQTSAGDAVMQPSGSPILPQELSPVRRAPVQAAPSSTSLLNTIKEELFAIESEMLTGTLSPDEYTRIKSGLEAVLKRELQKR